MTKKFRPSPFARLVQALPKILLGLFLFVGMPYAIAQATCEPLPDQTLDKAMRNEAPNQGLAPTKSDTPSPHAPSASSDGTPPPAGAPPATDAVKPPAAPTQ